MLDKPINFGIININYMKTYLEQFIREKLKNYDEPVRRGLPKGSRVGFTYAKYEASLHFLTHQSHKDIARRVGTSAGTIRVWRTQKEFQEQIERHRYQYAYRFVERLKQRAGENLQRYTNNVPPLTIDEFKDFGLYHPRLIRLITDLLTTELIKKRESELSEPASESLTLEQKLRSHRDFYFFADAFTIFTFTKKGMEPANKTYLELFELNREGLKEVAFRGVKKVLWNPKASLKEREVADLYLMFLYKKI